MIRGRLVAINGKRRARPTTIADDRAKRLVDREFNLSHDARRCRAHNELVGRPLDGRRGRAR